MALLPPIDLPDPTLEAADRALEMHERARPRRSYLGMSSVGHPCSRKLWYDYHGASGAKHSAATLKMFADGHASEDVQAARLRLVPGITLLTVDPATGRQWAYEDLDGKFKGHMDGAILGLLQAPKTWHVWEHKSANEKKAAKLTALKQQLGEKNALKAWDEVYHAQAVLYMHYSGMERHYLTCSTPGVRTTISVRTDADPVLAMLLKDKAERIITARAPLARISNDPSWFQCRFCDHHEVCHGGAK